MSFVLETLEEDGESKLSLRDTDDDSLSPLTVDFTSPGLLYRLKHGSGFNQPLAKAVLAREKPLVIDATAGLGTDALVMAALGCRVRSLERNELIFKLLEDGHARLVRRDPDLAARLSFEHVDARDLLVSLHEATLASGLTLESMAATLMNLKPDVVYLDPMYPEEGRSKSALPKKTMQLFRRLLSGDLDANELWQAAMKAALKRVVVKRPLHAPSLGDRKPTHSFAGKTARYDLYLTV